MTITIHLGVIDLPYTEAPAAAPKGKKGKARTKKASNVTTGDVAEILEHQYGIMEAFVDLNRPAVMQALENSLQDALEMQLLGGPQDADLFGPAMSTIETDFKQAIAEQFLDGLPGVPTKAAQNGVSHRFKHPYAKREPRASFVDTSLYVDSFKAWVD